ncbi:F-box/kelch-repeat protein At3g27150 [Diospyros lotus]|uniref:F-box/kelch-repeat protein At3g27150 n=1 Tax=Diospyros lotus TaxID=55363 RepID=UPI00224E84E2|nr:F-box/kelch-repeat protein At3g27150 [Diospyros lotus]XP_052195161.1 F-box/kelch-repeat protein At3g27150 [Diospyros lotus]XP_052195162.1 F-box/kelch-repeat protein At3g27150 [Diospyros lotus]XP_052195163.1 F-box/kelch-repeat protein At3g27150 [Diospyros lotus]
MFKREERETLEETENKEESEGLGKYSHCMGLDGDGGLEMDSGEGSATLPAEKIRIGETNHEPDQNSLVISPTGIDGSLGLEPQDADYSEMSSLDYELENLILAGLSRSEYGKLCFVNRRYLALVKSGELFKIRREIGIKESSVYMFGIGEDNWLAFDREFKTRRKLPILQTDICFVSGDRESFCAGAHLLVSGNECNGLVVWRYELAMNRWYKGPSMITPRCLFASATCGSFAFVAGGVGKEPNGQVYDTAERYNSESKSWEPLPKMKKRRKLCAGCYMDNKFYVIGGRNEEGELTCGEFFDEATNRWEPISDMLKDDPVLNCHSPPLVAVVNNQLYSLEASSNQLKVYLKSSNTWKHLGPVPVRADFNNGWGVAFKSLGDELLVIGASSDAANCMAIHTCCPRPDADQLHWRQVYMNRDQFSQFILNCSVMVA